MVDGVFDGQGVFVRKEGYVGFRLWPVIENAPVGDALAVGSDRSGGEVREQTLAVALVRAAAVPASVV